MPTVAASLEPIRPLALPPSTTRRDHLLDAILSDLRSSGVRPSRLNLIARAGDLGMSSDVAADLADLLDEGDQHGR